MTYEIIQEIKNSCANNQMRDVFFTELDIADPDLWIHEKESRADTIEREDLPQGIRYRVFSSGLCTEYTLTQAD